MSFVLFVSSVLASLGLCDNQIGVEGAKAIAAALRVNGALTSIGEGALSLRRNPLGDEGGGALLLSGCGDSHSVASACEFGFSGPSPIQLTNSSRSQRWHTKQPLSFIKKSLAMQRVQISPG